MTPRESVETVLKGGVSDKIPFTTYESKFPQCAAERKLRNQGLCMVRRDIPVYKTTTPNVKVTSRTYTANGKRLTRTEYETPVGNLYNITEPAGFTSWCHKRIFTQPEDYKPLLFLINDMCFEPNCDAFDYAQRTEGGDTFFRGHIGSEPLQTLISGYMGTETVKFRDGYFYPTPSALRELGQRWDENKGIEVIGNIHKSREGDK